MSNTTPHILHLHSSFAPGGKELRTVQLINAFGTRYRHTIVSAEAGELDAAQRIKRSVKVTLQPDFPPLTGLPLPGRLQKLARAMQGYDLVLTYGWGAMDAVMAHTLFSQVHGLPPLIHHEDGFDETELTRRSKRRNLYRKIALGKTSGLVIPSEALEEIALVEWEQPISRVKRIANGVDTARFGTVAKPDALPRLLKRPGELWVGVPAEGPSAKNLAALVRAFAPLPNNWQLVIIGEGVGRDAIIAEADRLEINHRIHLPGAVDDTAKVIGLFDIFALSGVREQCPPSVLEAMAAGLPVAAPDMGDISRMLSRENADVLAPFQAGDDLNGAFAALAFDDRLREELGKANKAKARAEFELADMIAAYKRLFASALDRTGK